MPTNHFDLVASQAAPPAGDGVGLRIALVLWSGLYGGAETWSVSLAEALRRRGAHPGVVIVGAPGPISDQMKKLDIPCEHLSLSRGAQVLRHPRLVSTAVQRMGTDAAIVPSAGYLSAILRIGGHRGPIVAVEHGCLLQFPNLPWHRRTIRTLDRLSGVRAVSAQVAPSNFMMRELQKHIHCGEVIKISLGLNISKYTTDVDSREGRPVAGEMIVGVAGRLITGKGIDLVLKAIADRTDAPMIRLVIAGDGPDRPNLEALASRLGLVDRVRFLGWIHDMASFWRRCDVAVVPSNEWIESFGMVAVEAMACGIPVIGSRRGGLAELVLHGETGTLFEPGDWKALALILAQYARDPSLRQEQGEAARRRCMDFYDIDRCAAEWESLLVRLVRTGSGRSSRVQIDN